MNHTFAIPKRELNPALYRAVLASPDDDAPRLAYADWFEQNGDPDRARFIRAECRLARLTPWHPEYSDLNDEAVTLLIRHDTAWRQGRPAIGLEARWQFERGFPEVLIFRNFQTAERLGDKPFRYYVRRLCFETLRSARR